ncbi:MAG: hypothetical protein ACREMD_12815, partial [Gemmatimonadota bacterium]
MPRKSDLGEKRARARTGKCLVCGDRFTPSCSDAKTCSSVCRQKSYRDRKRVTDSILRTPGSRRPRRNASTEAEPSATSGEPVGL